MILYNASTSLSLFFFLSAHISSLSDLILTLFSISLWNTTTIYTWSYIMHIIIYLFSYVNTELDRTHIYTKKTCFLSYFGWSVPYARWKIEQIILIIYWISMSWKLLIWSVFSILHKVLSSTLFQGLNKISWHFTVHIQRHEKSVLQNNSITNVKFQLEGQGVAAVLFYR